MAAGSLHKENNRRSIIRLKTSIRCQPMMTNISFYVGQFFYFPPFLFFFNGRLFFNLHRMEHAGIFNIVPVLGKFQVKAFVHEQLHTLQGISKIFKEVLVTSDRGAVKCKEFSIRTKWKRGHKQRSGLHNTNICVSVILVIHQDA